MGGLVGTGVMISTGRYPNIKFGRVSNGMTCGTTWANQIQTGIMALQQDAYNVRAPGFSTFASYIFNVQYVTGSPKPPTHSLLASVTASQHHNKNHAGDHIGDAKVWNTNAIATIGAYWVGGINKAIYTQGAIFVCVGNILYRSGNYGRNWQIVKNFYAWTV